MNNDLHNMTKKMPYAESEEYMERLIERCADTAIAERGRPRRSWGAIAACAAAAAAVIIAVTVTWKSATTMEQAENAIEVAAAAIDEAGTALEETAPATSPPIVATIPKSEKAVAKPATGTAAKNPAEETVESPLDEFLDNITDAEAQALLCFTVDEEPLNIN